MLESLRDAEDAESGGRPSSEGRPSVDSHLLRGLQGGLVGTVVMTAFRLPLMRSLPPSANFWAKYVGGGEPADYPRIGLLLHVVYGVSAGAVFGVLFEFLDSERAIEAEQRGIMWGAVYGMALSAFGSRVMLEALLDVRLEADELTLFHAGHLVYGITLGAWVGSRAEGASDPEEEYEYDD